MVSTRLHRTTLGQWRTAGGLQIVIDVGNNWDEVLEIVDNYMRDHPGEEPWSEEELIEAFYDQYLSTYLTERICVERYLQKIRLKRDHCKPCCVTPVAIAMCNHVNKVLMYHGR